MKFETRKAAFNPESQGSSIRPFAERQLEPLDGTWDPNLMVFSKN